MRGGKKRQEAAALQTAAPLERGGAPPLSGYSRDDPTPTVSISELRLQAGQSQLPVYCKL